jgi:hypothetical protein
MLSNTMNFQSNVPIPRMHPVPPIMTLPSRIVSLPLVAGGTETE